MVVNEFLIQGKGPVEEGICFVETFDLSNYRAIVIMIIVSQSPAILPETSPIQSNSSPSLHLHLNTQRGAEVYMPTSICSKLLFPKAADAKAFSCKQTNKDLTINLGPSCLDTAEWR